MTRTTEIEYHPDRTLVHFGSPAGTRYWKPRERVRYVEAKPKKGKREQNDD